MHIEPGYIAPAKLALANLTAVVVLAAHAGQALHSPGLLGRLLLAATFFSFFMQSYHRPVGPSELHFVGAMAIYLTMGYLPTLFGFAFGLLLQGWLFEPQDLLHLSVNSLSLIVPLMLVHHTLGKSYVEQARPLSWRAIVRLDGAYYAGVTAMVGFWLLLGDVQTPFLSWATFAASYLGLVILEPVLTMAAVRLLKRWQEHALVGYCCNIRALQVQACEDVVSDTLTV
ncbi:MAG: energy-coupling factor ABC transporter permease [Magnetococcales bacterium]|nr:energy-coupling factor ABC transporter permease [Magnetococcales bacterium]